MKQRQSMGGVGLLILMLLVIMFFSLKVPGMATERELSYPEFMVYLENKTVESAQIRPNSRCRPVRLFLRQPPATGRSSMCWM